MRRIGTIFILVSFLIGIYIVPINAAPVSPDPNSFFGIENNLLSLDYSSSTFSSWNHLPNGSLQLVSTGDQSMNRFYFFISPDPLMLAPGEYTFGFVYTADSDLGIHVYVSIDGNEELLITSSQYTFTLNYPSTCSFFIELPFYSNDSVQTYTCRPYLIYSNNSINSITSAFSSVIQAPFTAIASGFNSLSDQIIGIDNLITPFGTVLVFIVSIPLIVWGLNTLIGFITRPFKRR